VHTNILYFYPSTSRCGLVIFAQMSMHTR
jgi:hypothetical protein